MTLPETVRLAKQTLEDLIKWSSVQPTAKIVAWKWLKRVLLYKSKSYLVGRIWKTKCEKKFCFLLDIILTCSSLNFLKNESFVSVIRKSLMKYEHLTTSFQDFPLLPFVWNWMNKFEKQTMEKIFTANFFCADKQVGVLILLWIFWGLKN